VYVLSRSSQDCELLVSADLSLRHSGASFSDQALDKFPRFSDRCREAELGSPRARDPAALMGIFRGETSSSHDELAAENCATFLVNPGLRGFAVCSGFEKVKDQ
jgi:hypothetical protein